MNNVIYVFNENDKDMMLKCGYVLWKEDVENNLYIFIPGDKATFSLPDVDCFQTDVLPF